LDLSTSSALSPKADSFASQITASLLADMNTAKALGVLWEALDTGSGITDAERGQLVGLTDQVLGLDLGKPMDDFKVVVSAEADELLCQRNEARAQKNWAQADALRDQLADMGYEIMDDPVNGPTLRKR
jgi:cysteinyl-tRNA synthetase